MIREERKPIPGLNEDGEEGEGHTSWGRCSAGSHPRGRGWNRWSDRVPLQSLLEASLEGTVGPLQLLLPSPSMDNICMSGEQRTITEHRGDPSKSDLFFLGA